MKLKNAVGLPAAI